jgi:glycosyltransferase involved in cell wall biosynthesis
MNILHVAAGLQETCGVSQFVVESSRALQRLGHRVGIVTTMTCGYPVDDLDVRLLADPRQIDFKPDVVHLHSIWNRYVHAMAVYCRQHGIPYVFSPHGTLTKKALMYKWWKKIPAMLLYQYIDLLKAKGFHLTTESEVDGVRRLHLRQPVTVAPLGVSISDRIESVRSKDVLFLGRIHPIKGLVELLHAWKSVVREGWRLLIAGPDDIGYQAELVSLCGELRLKCADLSGSFEYGKKQIFGGGEVSASAYAEALTELSADVVFLGSVYGEAKSWLYRHARLFVLPSHSENFGVVVLEAMAEGTPVIATRGTPWQVLEECGCGWWVEQAGLVDALSRGMELSESEYAKMSSSCRQLVIESYSWDSVGMKLIELYEGVTG